MTKLLTQDSFIFPPHRFSEKKGDLTRACLVARGYEELELIQKDSPTVSRDGFCIFLFIASNH